MVDLPVDCGGMVSLSPDGHFNIYLNARLDRATQRKKFLHELRHILNDDFNNSDDIYTVESRADAHATGSRCLPPLFKARDLLQQTPSVAAASTPPRSQTNPPAPQLSPHQTAVLLRAISDLDDWLFRDTTYDL
jgi:hypothetical protein